MNRVAISHVILSCAVFVSSVLILTSLGLADSQPYRSPFDVAFSPAGNTLAVSDHTARSVAIINFNAVEKTHRLRHVKLNGQPTGVAWADDGSRFFVAEYGTSSVAEVEMASGKVLRRFRVGLRPVGLAVVPKRQLLIVANTVSDDVSIVDLRSATEQVRIKVPREPYFVAVTPDESLAVVGNLLPAGSAEDPNLAAAISILNLEGLRHVADVRLPPGSTSVRKVLVSHNGRWAYAVHTLGRFNLPATQLERGWVSTNALSILDLTAKRLHTTVLLDHVSSGATDPWGLAMSRDSGTLWISLRGVHEIARVDLEQLHSLLDGKLTESRASTQLAGITRNIWWQIKDDPSRKEMLMNDLSALHVAGLIKTYPLSGKGPRGLDLSPDDQHLAVAVYYSGTVVLMDAKTGTMKLAIPLGPSPKPDLVRRGEILFHDATICFQRWLSCATCHPDEGRLDGLRWDLLNDGLGTPQRTRSLLWSHRTRPTTARGVRASVEDSVPKGLAFFLRTPDPELAEPLIAYLKSLKPEASPFLVDGGLSESARRGKALFETKAKCTECHEGELGTDMKAHNVGTRGEFDSPDDVFYTPKLVELYRTAPYLHDGRAATLMDIFTRHDPENKHKKVTFLKKNELEDLVEYLKSL